MLLPTFMQTRFISQVLRNPRLLFSSGTPLISPIARTKHRSRPLIATASRYSTVGAQVNADTRDHDTGGGARRVIENDEQEGRANYPAKRYPRRTLIVRQFDPELTTLDDLRELLSPYGEIKQISMYSSRQLFIALFDSVRSARQQCLLCRVLFSNSSEGGHLEAPQPPAHPEQPAALRQLRRRHRGCGDTNKPRLGDRAGCLDAAEPGRAKSHLLAFRACRERHPRCVRFPSCYSPRSQAAVDRRGFNSCIIRYTSESEAAAAIKAHRLKRLRYRGLSLQLRFGRPPNQTAREPNPTLHVMGFFGTPEKLVSFIPGQADRLEDLHMSAWATRLCYETLLTERRPSKGRVT